MPVKDAYWFKHDSNAKDDPKCVLLIEQLGLEGYGIYWMLVETLRDQADYKYPLALVSALARRYNTSAQKVVAIINGYGLFSTDDSEFFYSDSLIGRMKTLDDKKEQARLAGIASAQKRKKQALLNTGSTEVEQTFNARSTIREDNTRKDETIEDESFVAQSEKSVHGEFNNVILTADEYCKLADGYSDYKERIEKLSAYIESTGKNYNSHYATLLAWAQRDGVSPAKPKAKKEPVRQFESDEQREQQADFITSLFAGKKSYVDLDGRAL